MVYECPQCKTALPPGSGVCPNCGLKFETPTPLDATLPPPVSQAALPPYASSLPSGGGSASAVLPPVEDMPAAPTASGTPTRNVILALVALCIIIGAVAIFAVRIFVQQEASTTVPPPAIPVTRPVTPAPNVPARTMSSGSGPNLAPVTLPAGTGGDRSVTRSTGASDASAIAGRWQSKSSNYYVLNGDGTGYRGNLDTGKRETSFSWVLVNGTLILNGAKHEELSLNSGPDANTIYLRGANGKYDAYSRVATQ